MTKYITEYMNYIRSCLEDESCDFEALLEYHSKHLEFFMHERLIHLIVTVLFAILTVATFLIIACTEQVILSPLALLFLCLLIPYIKHYYFLENKTQEMYQDYEKLYEKVKGFSINDSREN